MTKIETERLILREMTPEEFDTELQLKSLKKILIGVQYEIFSCFIFPPIERYLFSSVSKKRSANRIYRIALRLSVWHHDFFNFPSLRRVVQVYLHFWQQSRGVSDGFADAEACQNLSDFPVWGRTITSYDQSGKAMHSEPRKKVCSPRCFNHFFFREFVLRSHSLHSFIFEIDCLIHIDKCILCIVAVKGASVNSR